MSESQTVEADVFVERMAPTVEALQAFTKAVNDVAPRHANVPAPDSQAMRELAAEDDYRSRSSWQNPITDTHMFGEMTLRAACDYVRSFATALTAERPPLYGHLVLARSALESSVVSAWLNEPDIAYVERVKRGLCERLYSANEIKNLELTPGAAEEVTQLEADATSFGWKSHFGRGGKPEVDKTKRPSVGNGITRLLVEDSQARIGRLLWSRLSAVTHVTWWGLQWALMLPEGGPSGPGGFATVPVGTDSTRVAIQAWCALRALRAAANRRFMLMGWSDHEWQDAASRAEAYEYTLFQSAVPSPSPPASGLDIPR
jgi:hypothetical protein